MTDPLSKVQPPAPMMESAWAAGSLWNSGSNDVFDAAQRLPAIGHTTGFSENFAAEWESLRRTNLFFSEAGNLDETYRDLYDEARAVGVPFKYQMDFSPIISGEDQYYGTDIQTAPNYRDSPQLMLQEINEYKAKNIDLNPELRWLPSTEEEVLNRIRKKVRGVVQESENIGERATTGGAIARFGADFTLSALDPPNLASMLLGAPAGVGILRGALIEAGINMGSEALQQPQVQSYRAELGLDAGFDQAMENIGFAGLGAGGPLYARPLRWPRHQQPHEAVPREGGPPLPRAAGGGRLPRPDGGSAKRQSLRSEYPGGR